MYIVHQRRLHRLQGWTSSEMELAPPSLLGRSSNLEVVRVLLLKFSASPLPLYAASGGMMGLSMPEILGFQFSSWWHLAVLLQSPENLV